LVRIGAERYHKASGKTEREIRYCITSLKPDEAWLNQTIHGKRLQKTWDHDYLLKILGVHVLMRLP
jgi:hypothetical protein